MAENVTLSSFATLNNSSITSTLNSNNSLIETAFADCFSLSGTSPNSMLANLDMNNFQILNLPAPSTVNSPARLVDVTTALTTTITQNFSRMNFTLKGVNFNSTNTDNAISISIPAGFTRYRIAGVVVENASHSLSTATCGIFSSTGGGGTTIAANQSITVTTSSANTNNNSQLLTLTNNNSTSFTFTTLQFRIGTAEGVAATGDVVFMVDLLT